MYATLHSALQRRTDASAVLGSSACFEERSTLCSVDCEGELAESASDYTLGASVRRRVARRMKCSRARERPRACTRECESRALPQPHRPMAHLEGGVELADEPPMRVEPSHFGYVATCLRAIYVDLSSVRRPNASRSIFVLGSRLIIEMASERVVERKIGRHQRGELGQDVQNEPSFIAFR